MYFIFRIITTMATVFCVSVTPLLLSIAIVKCEQKCYERKMCQKNQKEQADKFKKQTQKKQKKYNSQRLLDYVEYKYHDSMRNYYKLALAKTKEI